jgi:predicted transcriptional regulator YdeE
MTAFVEPRFLDGMTLIGYSEEFLSALAPDSNSQDVIPEIWGKLFDLLDESDEFEFGWAVGVMTPSKDPSAKPGQMEYFAGLVTEDLPESHPGLEVRKVAASNYLICEHLGSLDELADTTVWFYSDYLPGAGFEEKDAPHLEVYDERFDPDSSESVVMICAPIAG